MNTPTARPEKRTKLKPFIWMGLIALVAWALTGFVVSRNFNDWPERGQWGDSFGAINALFSSMALGSAVLAILLQSKELELQREELALSREEMKNSVQALQSAAESQSLQIIIQAKTTLINGKQGMLELIEREALRLKERGIQTPGGSYSEVDRKGRALKAEIESHLSDLDHLVKRAEDSHFTPPA